MANLEDQISVNAADMYGNAIPDTAISFKTYNTGGFFTPNTATTTNGLATSTLHSGGTYLQPSQGFVSVTAEANGGRTTHVTSIAVTPYPYQHIIYAGTDGGGVYKSSDSGASWMNVSRSSTIQGQNWIDPYINDLTVDPDYPDTIYAATGYSGTGNLYRSLDGGMTWNSNNTEEWHGIFSGDQAVLTVLCDDGESEESDYAWIGTEGLGALYAPDGENFTWGGIVNPIPPTNEDICDDDPCYKSTLNIGNGHMTIPRLTSSSKTEIWTLTYNVPPASATSGVSSSGNQGNGSISDVDIDPLFTKTETWRVTYQTTAGTVTKSIPGIGTVYNIKPKIPNAPTETWTLTCADDASPGAEIFTVETDAGVSFPNATVGEDYSENAISFKIIPGGANFSLGDTLTFTTTAFWEVSGSVSGVQTNKAITGIYYTSDSSEVGFTIDQGTKLFGEGDTFTFTTTASPTYWSVEGDVSGDQTKKAHVGLPYISDNNEIGFTIEEGFISFADGDSFSFHITESGLGNGRVVRDIVKVPDKNKDEAVLYAATNTGVFRSADGGQTWRKTTSFAGDFVNTLALHPASNGTKDIIYAGTEDAGVWVNTNSGYNTWTAYNEGMGKGLSATVPVPDRDNTGNGVINEVVANPNAKSEYWSVECITEDGATFSVTGTVSGKQSNATVGSAYTSNDSEISFTIADGSTDFEINDTFTFSTTRDHGRTIKDLLVDSVNRKLYAITYFWGPLEAHAVGNVYSVSLDSNYEPSGEWSEANTNLPQYDPPDDTTLFAQHVMAADIPGSPTALYIGGEGINLYKAASGIDTGAPEWHQSKSGLTNLIMARMPILFSGECHMYINEEEQDGSIIYTIYIQDANGNPPIAGSTFKVEYKQGEDTTVFFDKKYPDTYTYQGTWRDWADISTNIPYITPPITPMPGDEITFTFKPACDEEVPPKAPGCSGSEQKYPKKF